VYWAIVTTLGKVGARVSPTKTQLLVLNHLEQGSLPYLGAETFGARGEDRWIFGGYQNRGLAASFPVLGVSPDQAREQGMDLRTFLDESNAI
jgi:hypothetical protein